MPSRRWMWIRPTPHIYAYNRELSTMSGSSSATASATQAVSSYRSARASSEVAQDRSSMTRMSRATTVAPPGSSLVGYTGYYGRQLALHRQAEREGSAARSSAAANSATAARASSAAAASASAISTARAASSVSAAKESRSNVSISAKSTTVEAVKTTVEREEKHVMERRAQLMKMQEKSISEGRQSVSRAVRRAEQHAESSGRDPRHVGLPRDTSDDILKKIADIHMTPYDTRELNAAKSALAQGHLKIERMEKELSAITQSAMKYQSMYSKSAAQMAKEAIEASEMEAMASTKKTRKTVVEETKRGGRVAAA